MEFRKTRKGFTIVELVIVIAVIGILSAILIPTFIHLTNKAEEASDVSVVKNANIQLAMKEAAEGKNTSMNQAVKDVDEIGYHIPGLSLASGNKIVWDSNSDRFVLLNEDNEVKHKDSDVVAPHSKLFKPVSSLADREDFAVYALSGYQENATEVTFTEAISFDSGDSEVTSITYNGVSTEAGDYVFVGTTPTVDNLVINSPLASFKHGGVIREAGVASVKAGESYHELGRGGYIEMGTGDFVAEGSANIKVLYFADENADYTKISGAVVNEYAKTQGVKDALDLTGSAIKSDIQVKSSTEMVSIKGDAIAEFNKEVNPVSVIEVTQTNYATVFVSEYQDYILAEDIAADYMTFEIPEGMVVNLNMNGHNITCAKDVDFMDTIINQSNKNFLKTVSCIVNNGTLTLSGEGTIGGPTGWLGIINEGTLTLDGDQIIRGGTLYFEEEGVTVALSPLSNSGTLNAEGYKYYSGGNEYNAYASGKSSTWTFEKK